MKLLEVEHVSKFYTGHTALDDVSLEIPEGCVYGLLGPNGAGKTTLIRIINHITAPDKGRVLINGRPLVADDVYNIGYLPEERGLYKKMKVGDQAIFFARLKGLSRADAITKLRYWFEKFDIMQWWDKKVEELSKGMAQKIQFIITVLHEPKLLIFDEPFSGFDPINAQLLKDEILGLKEKGATVIFSTHNMSSVEEVCEYITLINKSHNVLSGKVDDIRHQFGDGRYCINYRGDNDTLMSAVENMLKVEKSEAQPGGDINCTFKLNEGVILKDVIAAVNNAVELRSLNDAVTSMNDIFIQTVKTYNSINS